MVSVLLSRLQCQNLDVRHINTLNCKMLCVDSPQNVIIHPSFVSFLLLHWRTECNWTFYIHSSFCYWNLLLLLECICNVWISFGYGITDTAWKSLLKKE